MIYRTLIHPILNYGCESWALKRRDQNLISVFERKVLRTIIGAMREGERWRSRYNFELQRNYGEPDIVTVVKVQRLRWAGHLARMNENRAPSILFRNNPDGQRGVGRPKMRWMDGVQADLRALGVINWKAAALDRERWSSILDQAKTHMWS